MLLLAFFLLDIEKSVDVVNVGWPDLAQAFSNGSGRRSCGWIWEPKELGRGPGCWVTTIFVLSFWDMCLLRLRSKPWRDGIPLVHGGVRLHRR